MSSPASKCIVEFYKIWHGKLHLPGAGKLINLFSTRLTGLQNYPLTLTNGSVVEVDFRELSAFGWLNFMLGDHFQEAPLVKALSEHLRPDSVFWDIGANAGVLSYQVSRTTKLREHHYFEPNPKLYKWASGALSLSANATGHQTALSDKCGEALLYIPRNRSAYGSLNKVDQTEADEVRVKMATCDSIVFEQGFSAPDVIKIDTEGHEVEVLAGMKELIKIHRPIVFFEHIEIDDAAIRSMTPAGYGLKTICNATGQLTKSFDRQAGHNSVFIPSPA